VLVVHRLACSRATQGWRAALEHLRQRPDRPAALDNVPFATGNIRVHRIDAQHAGYEDNPLPTENLDSYERLRQRTTVPLVAGEQLGKKWQFCALIEGELIDHARVDVANTGLAEARKIAAVAEAHPRVVGRLDHGAAAACGTDHPQRRARPGHRTRPGGVHARARPQSRRPGPAFIAQTGSSRVGDEV
jgi:hypothetical protein